MNKAQASSLMRSLPLVGAAGALLALALAAGGMMGVSMSSAQEGIEIPAPAVDAPAASGAAMEVAVLAGGCFWGVQGVFQHVEGVMNAVSGYAGGEAQTAKYDMVTTGMTGHAESVEITFDPSRISYGRILQIFFSAAHDPTQLNRQGPDIGTHYRTAIFPRSPEQAEIAKAYIEQLNQARVFNAAIVTKIEPDQAFYAAEDYHQDFLVRNPTYPYIVIHDLPKLENLKRLFPDVYRAEPRLVSMAQVSD